MVLESMITMVKIENWRFLNQNKEIFKKKNKEITILLCVRHLQSGKIQEKTVPY